MWQFSQWHLKTCNYWLRKQLGNRDEPSKRPATDKIPGCNRLQGKGKEQQVSQEKRGKQETNKWKDNLKRVSKNFITFPIAKK